MKNFIVYDASGTILGTGTCPESYLENPQLLPGTFIMEGVASDVLHRIENGKLVAKPQTPAPAPDYTQLRVAEYPSFGDLADALYWQSKGDQSYWQAYAAKIDAIKKKYPKP